MIGAVESRSPFRQAVRRFMRNRFALVCGWTFVVLVVGSILVPMPGIRRYDPNEQHRDHVLEGPSGQFWLGTDALGRDLFTRTFWGCRITFLIGVAATFLSVTIGIAYGGISGYAGGNVDGMMMRLVDVLYGLPLLVFTMLVINVLGPYYTVWNTAHPHAFPIEYAWVWNIVLIFIAIGAIGWLTTARIVRGQVLSLKEQEFVQSARALGATGTRTLFVHIVPNLMGPVIVYATLTLPSVMLFESFISFLGLGVQEPNASLGILIDDGAKQLIPSKIYWWLLAFPSVILAVSLFCLNAVGDGLRDAMDVQAKETA